MHNEIADDVELAAGAKDVRLLLVREWLRGSQAEKAIRGGVVAFQASCRSRDAVGDAHREAVGTIELEQTRQLTLANDFAVRNVGSGDEDRARQTLS